MVALALPPLNAAAAARTKTVTKTVLGTTVVCKKWGSIQVQLKVATTIAGGKARIKIVDVAWPVWPQHTVRSVFINERALPLLKQEVLQLQSANLEVISGATDITVAFRQSLQAALLAAKKLP